MKAIVIGAGLAGLVAARTLHRAGWAVTVLEAGDGVGGRVRTDVVDGFRLDRGFHALFAAAPAVRRQLDLKALRLRWFDRGLVVVEEGRWHELGHPLHDVKALAPTLLSTLGRMSDKVEALKLARAVKRSPDRFDAAADVSAAEFLRRRGFSARFLELVLRNAVGALFLDPSLSTSAQRFLTEARMLALGRAGVPRDGMQAIPDQLAAALPEGAVRLNTPALRLDRALGRVTGVLTSDERLTADAVVLAAHAPEAERLSGLTLPKEAHGATCLYFRLPYPLYGHKKIVVSAFPDGAVTSAVQITNVAPSYAPEAEHLLSATIVGTPDSTAEELTAQTLADLQRWFPWRRLAGLKPLAVYQMPFGRLAEPPGFAAGRPSNRTPVKGLYLAGEYTTTSSIDGALTSGENAAAAILEDFRARA